MKKFMFLFIAALMLIFAMNCFAEETPAAYTNGGLKLSVPAEYADLLIIEMPENDEKNMLFSVSEKESVDAAQKLGYTWSGAGWLFGIGTVDEEKYHEMLCGDMTGVEVFAKDGNGTYYMFYHPTDVRMVREDNSYMAKDMEKWGELNQWAYSMRQTFIDDNGLTSETHTNTVPDMFLARLMYHEDENYTVSTTEYGPMEPHGVKAADIIAPLFNNVTFKYLPGEEAPDGEYVVLSFPDEDLRIDFFFPEGYENYVRAVWNNGQTEELLLAEVSDENIKASAVMNDLYHEMVLANSLGYTPDDLIGTWAEKIAGRGSIEISKGDEEGSYKVFIHWGSSAFEASQWTMTAYPTGNGAELRYNDCTMTDIVFTSDDQSTETVRYENGTGTFSLLSTYELVWNDETGHAADDNVFVNAG